MGKTWNNILNVATKQGLKDIGARHVLPTAIYSQEDLTANDWLIDVSTTAIRRAWSMPLDVGKAGLADSDFLNVFPGEHYRLLAALAQVMATKNVVEIGTFTGMGTLSLRAGMIEGTVTTFDIIAWDALPQPSHFVPADLDDGRIVQIIGDLTDNDVFDASFDVLEAADIIFMDAPKDGVFEYKMMVQLMKLAPRQKKLLILDDIRFRNMIKLWRAIASPKLDLSSFGHWSGTGIVDISAGLAFTV
ncbi:MAG: methyltransferase [Deltaproteobacteria bacterium]